jgi:nucleotide-binding universal stress UspA family protein
VRSRANAADRSFVNSTFGRLRDVVPLRDSRPEAETRVPKPKTSTKPPFIQSVVHATDFSAADERAFAHALGVALLTQAQLTILHVASDAPRDWHGFPAVRKTLERWKLLETGSSQEAVFEKLGVGVAKVALQGRFPALAVAQHLEHAPADLLVVATEGREGVARWLQGSVAEAMARWSRTMTLFVPADSQRNLVALADGNLTLENVLIPVDRTPDPSAALEFARRAAAVMSEKKATITLLHVGDGEELSSMRAHDGPQWSFTRMHRDGEPVEEIVAAAELVRAELIVMPTEGRHGVFDALRGSTTERVLRRARCPVLAVPAARA